MARVAKPVVAHDGLYAYLADVLATPLGIPVEVPHYRLPEWAKLPRAGRPGQLGLRVKVFPDDTLTVRDTTAAEWLEENGV